MTFLHMWDFVARVVGSWYLGQYIAQFGWWLFHPCMFCKKRYRKSRSDSKYEACFCSKICQRCYTDVPGSIRIAEVAE